MTITLYDDDGGLARSLGWEPPEPEPEWVRCVEPVTGVTAGKVYKVVRRQPGGVVVTNDNGNNERYIPFRFIPASGPDTAGLW